MIIVTGGAGFIGSCIVRELNDMGYTDLVIVDHIQKTEKWKNMRNKDYTEYISRILIFYIEIILNIQRRYGNSVRKITVLFFMRAVRQPMGQENADLMTGWILRSSGR